MESTLPAGLAFLRAQGWRPTAAEKRYAAHLADPTSRELFYRAKDAVDATLKGFIEEAQAHTLHLLQADGSVHSSRIHRLEELAEEAASLMSRPPQMPKPGPAVYRARADLTVT